MIPLLTISWDKRATFIERPNRFLGLCNIEDKNRPVRAHIKDPGRLKELLYPGNHVLLKRANGANRKTKWDLIAARSTDLNSWVLVNSGYHSLIARNILLHKEISPYKSIKDIRSEVKVQNSRLDFLITLKNDEKIFIEVKGCTLEKDGKALFPDAPTARGVRHLEELLNIVKSGYGAAIFFLIFCQNVTCFSANRGTDKRFYKVFNEISKSDTSIYCFLLEYKEDFKVYFKEMLPLCKDL